MKYLQLIFLSLLLYSCSQYSDKKRSKFWHSFNAKYNAYLQAKDLYNEAEKGVQDLYKDNYSELLPILPPLDSTLSKGFNTQLESTIKKSSIIALKHQNSKYVGNAYLLIGKARLLKGDFINAIETFKYVNSEANVEDQKYEALVALMQTYYYSEDYGTALRVGEILKTLDLKKTDETNFYLTKAAIHQKEGNYKLATAIMEQALPLLKKGEKKARLHFATGQMYEKLKDTRNAALQYDLVKNNRPSYDLGFYAQLNKMLFSPGQSLESTFKKLENDQKNIDLLDKLYYSMALLEEDKNNLPKAIDLLKKATKVKAQGTANVANAYLKLADIHYYRLQEYEKAKAFYDSTLAILPQTSANYTQIVDRKRALDEFSDEMKSVRLQDSLQKMYAMSPELLDKFLTESINQKLALEKEALEKAAKEKALAASALPKSSIATATSGNAWYMYDENKVSIGKIEFQQRWGQRKLEDNWRRISKQATLSNPNTIDNDTLIAKVIDDDASKIAQMKEEILKQIPKNEADIKASNFIKEGAYFKIGKLYKQSLLENEKSITSFKKVLDLNPVSEHAAESMYFLFLTEENAKEYWKAQLNEKYPKSFFTRKANLNQDKLSNKDEDQAEITYQNAYQKYINGENDAASQRLNEGLKNYPGSNFEDRFSFLQILIYSKTQNKGAYNKALDEFLLTHQKSSLSKLAKDMKNLIEPPKVNNELEDIQNKE